MFYKTATPINVLKSSCVKVPKYYPVTSFSLLIKICTYFWIAQVLSLLNLVFAMV